MSKKRQILLLVVLVVLALLVWSFEWQKHAPDVQTAHFIQSYKPLGVENPQIRWAELLRAQKTDYKSNGRNPFSVIAPPTPAEVAREKNKHPQVNTLPLPPPPPTEAKLPPNLKYFGYGAVPVGSARRAFITDGDEIFIVTEGDTLLGRFRILRVGNSNLEFQEISSGLHGTTPLEEPPGSPSA